MDGSVLSIPDTICQVARWIDLYQVHCVLVQVQSDLYHVAGTRRSERKIPCQVRRKAPGEVRRKFPANASSRDQGPVNRITSVIIDNFKETCHLLRPCLSQMVMAGQVPSAFDKETCEKTADEKVWKTI